MYITNKQTNKQVLKEFFFKIAEKNLKQKKQKKTKKQKKKTNMKHEQIEKKNE